MPASSQAQGDQAPEFAYKGGREEPEFAPEDGCEESEPSDGSVARKLGSARLTPQTLSAGLYVVATPIGNLADITLRAVASLRAADLIACEDTRITRRLLDRHGITTPLTPYHEHNAARAGPRLIQRLVEGASVALVSDAGTPLISDPGYRLINAAREVEIPIVPVPGPSAVTAALSVSGLPTDRFLFVGFLPGRQGERRRAIADIADIRATLVLFEAARRIASTLDDLAHGLGPRPTVIAREITKRFEELRRGTLAELATHYGDAGPPRGEIVVVIGPPEKGARDEMSAESEASADLLLREALENEPPSRAATLVAAATGLPRRGLYARALEIRKGA